MSGLKEIRRRITSVGNTKQITRAMKLVSAAKLKKSQEAALGARDFASRLDRVLEGLGDSLPEDFSHPLLGVREKQTAQQIVFISGERGLCGGFNVNGVKMLSSELKRRFEENSELEKIELVTLGRQGFLGANRILPDFGDKVKIIDSFEGLGEDVSSWPLADLADSCVESFNSGRVDHIDLLFTRFESAVTQTVTVESLLPFSLDLTSGGESEDSGAAKSEEAGVEGAGPKCDPSADKIVGQLIPVLIQSQLTQASLESKASEHAARMTAMDAATRNASELIEKLKLYYNRARQSAITTELIDIVGGAEATS